MQSLPDYIAPQHFSDAQAAVAQVRKIYEASARHLRAQLQRYVHGESLPGRARAFYPLVRVRLKTRGQADSRQSYGFLSEPGTYEATLTQPELFEAYWLEQLGLLLANHGEPIEVATSNEPMPVHFCLAEHDTLEGEMSAERRARLGDWFDLPNLAQMDDSIANGTRDLNPALPQPLSLFTAARVDYSIQRLRHYSGTSATLFQSFVLFTNYQFYIDEFVKLGQSLMDNPHSPYKAFVQPGNVVTMRRERDAAEAVTTGTPPPRLPQMPAYHLVADGGMGVTMVNIGVGPANAKTMTDHVAVLRPHAWIMLGHCAGLRNSQQLGDYVLAHAYVRDDKVLDEELPQWVPIPALAEIQLALEAAVAEVTQLDGWDLKRVLRTGTVASTDNRNWELLSHPGPERRFSQSRAVALDMESATIAANGFRFRVPYGTLLCVSDKPLHGEIKLPGMANTFYRERVDQHLRIGLKTMELLSSRRTEKLHSRKLRSFSEVPFR